MTKQIGILTFHYADNYGAVLQAYALRKVINSFKDCHAEIINYVPKGYHYYVSSDAAIAYRQREKREKFSKFLSGHCGLHTPMLHSVTGNEYDVYLVGSDQVWNTELIEVSSDYEYFLPHVNEEAKRIAYSASIGMDFEKIDRSLFQKYLSKFQSISVREKSYVEIISELSEKSCEYTLDPTMLLSGKDYAHLLIEPNIEEKPYILYFWYDMGDKGYGSVETVNILARKYGLSIKHTFLPYGHNASQLLANNVGCIMYSGIEEFLWYIKNAQIVVTNSFHGTVFSILFGRPVYIFYPELRKCRQQNLVEMLEIRDRVVQKYMNPDELTMEMDYKAIFQMLEKERKKSLSYLNDALHEI